MGVGFPEKKVLRRCTIQCYLRYEGVGVKFPGKKRYVTLEWPLRRDNESGRNRKQSPGKVIEVVWACDEKRGTLHRKEGDGNESTGDKEERKA